MKQNTVTVEKEMLSDDEIVQSDWGRSNPIPAKSIQPPKLNQAVINDILQTLTLPQKELCAKYFYDNEGSNLFDQICQQPEYYPYRAEVTLLPQVAQKLAERFKKSIDLVEFGAGSLIKVKHLLDHLPNVSCYYPVDIAAEHLQVSAANLKKCYPKLNVFPIEADFTQKMKLPKFSNSIKLGFFPGSTIGNLSRSKSLEFLNQVRRSLGKGAFLLIGVDTKKSASELHRAYNDKNGITEAFNLNMLRHLNTQTGANFNLEAYEHYAFYNPTESRIEMHLVSQFEQVVSIDGHNIYIAEGESIHTENAYKYNRQDFMHLASKAGWQVEDAWLAEHNQFSLYLLSAR